MFTRRDFYLSDEQYETIKTWAESHECKCKYGNRPSRSCCGGEISVTFTPTSVGTFISASCICGEQIDVDVD